jgi:hypothetical protein
MKRSHLFSMLLGTASSVICAGALAAGSPASAGIGLQAPEGFIPVAIDPVGPERYCVSGQVLDDASATTTAYVVLVDSAQRKVVWKRSVPFAKDHVGSEALHCVLGADDSSYFVLTKESTNSSEALNQGKLFVQKYSADGKLLKQQRLAAGFDEWGYLLEANRRGVTVAGGTNDAMQRGGKFSTFVSTYDTDLAQRQAFASLPTGAYWVDADARYDGQHLLVGGQFMGNAAKSGDKPYAASKIDVSANRYVWSAHLYPLNVDSAVPLVNADGSMVYAALTASELQVAVLDPAGRIAQNVTVSKPLCEITGVGMQGQTVSLLGKTCESGADKQARSAIVEVDLARKRAGPVQRLNEEVRAARFDNGQWVAVLIDGATRRASLRRFTR